MHKYAKIGEAILMGTLIACLNILIYGALIVLGLSLLLTKVTLLIGESNAHPASHFLQFKNWKPGRDDYTLVNNFWADQKNIQRVMGVAGDVVRVDGNNGIFINNRWIGFAKSERSNDMDLSPFEATKIPKGYVFLDGPHPIHFYSSYEEKRGLISVKELQGRVIPLW